MASDLNVNEKLESLFKNVFDNFSCPICMEYYDKVNHPTYMTFCGHRFCKNCIDQIVRDFKKCSICKKPLGASDYIRDCTFESLIDEMKILKENQIKSVVSSIVETVNNETMQNLDLKSPLYGVLKKHMAKSLTLHENYLNQMKKDLNNQLSLIDEKLNKDIQSATGYNAQAQIYELTRQAEQDKSNLRADFEKKVEGLANKYSSFLDQIGITPLSLPVSVKLRVIPFNGRLGHKKSFRIEGFELKNYKDMNELIDFMSRKVKKDKDDEIVSVPDDLLVLNIGPFANQTDDELSDMCENFLRYQRLPPLVDVLRSQSKKNCFPIQEFFVKPDSEFVFYGDFKFKSDMPKQCFKFAFETLPAPRIVNYYECQQCNQKWICQSCKESCHRNHQTSVLSPKHQATWACCYCQKTNCCQLDEKKTSTVF